MYVLSKRIKNIKIFLVKFSFFTNEFFTDAWASFRNVKCFVVGVAVHMSHAYTNSFSTHQNCKVFHV